MTTALAAEGQQPSAAVVGPVVVGLDLSLTATGVALSDGTAATLTTTERGMPRLADLRHRICSVCATADLVVIEGYSMGGQRGSSGVAQALGELGGVVRLSLHERGIRYVDVPPATLKKYATGKGNASKNDMLGAAIRRLDYSGSSGDEADALWLRAMGLDAVGSPVVLLPAVHRQALTKIAWPNIGGAA